MPARLVVARHVDDRTLGPPDHRCAQPRHTGPNVAGEDQHIGVSAVRRPPAALKVQVAENLKAHTASMADANGRARVPKRRVTLASPRTAVARGRARLPTGTDEARASVGRSARSRFARGAVTSWDARLLTPPWSPPPRTPTAGRRGWRRRSG